jgi:protein required for attachment to host cells
MKPRRTWILIADGARARIAVNEGVGKGIRPVFNHEFAAPHPPTREFGSDRPGRYSAPTAGGRHAVEAPVDRHEYEKFLFAKDLAAVVERAASGKQFDRLVLVAPPTALGRLRLALTPRTRRMISAEISKDLTHVPFRELPAFLGDAIAV